MRQPGLAFIALDCVALSPSILVSAGSHTAVYATLDRAARELVARAAERPRLQRALRRALFRKRSLDACPPDQWVVSFNATAPTASVVASPWTLSHEWAGASFFEGWDFVLVCVRTR